MDVLARAVRAMDKPLLDSTNTTDKMSSPPENHAVQGHVRQACCPDNAYPFKAEDPNYQAQGSMITLPNCSYQAYSVGSGKHAVLFIHDIFGLPTGMNKQICDQYAEQMPNHIILAPDFFKDYGYLCGNDPLTSRNRSALTAKILWALCCCRLFSFIRQHNWQGVVGEIFDGSMSYLLNDLKVDSVVTLGVCWGSYVNFKAMSASSYANRILANVSIHPSVHSLASMYGDKEMDLVEAACCPQLIAATKDEPPAWKPNGKVDQALRKKAFAADCEFYVYGGQNHGFFSRGDSTNAETLAAMTDFFDNSIRFIRKHENKQIH